MESSKNKNVGVNMCYKPIQIYDKNTDSYIKASCRKCLECMQVRANEWALRGHFELLEHKENCFITLTYANNPVRLHKEHMQLFIKRLRKSLPKDKKIKYFSCGEYGDQQMRPHYHIIIFGHDFDDKRFVKMSKSDIPIYESKQLNKLWEYGITTLQNANVNTIRYSALYSTKLKQDLPENLKKYPEFNTMSQNLGIESILKNMDTYIKTDQIYLDGFAYMIPNIILQKYYIKKYGLVDHKNVIDINGEQITQYTTYLDYVQEYKTERNFRYNSKEQLLIRERLSQKKLLHTKLRQL